MSLHDIYYHLHERRPILSSSILIVQSSVWSPKAVNTNPPMNIRAGGLYPRREGKERQIIPLWKYLDQKPAFSLRAPTLVLEIIGCEKASQGLCVTFSSVLPVTRRGCELLGLTKSRRLLINSSYKQCTCYTTGL